MMPKCMRPLHGYRCALPNNSLVPAHIVFLPPILSPSPQTRCKHPFLTTPLSLSISFGEENWNSSPLLFLFLVLLLRRRAVAMARKCSSCGNNGHNSRTCSGHGRVVFENGGGGGVGGVRLFGVQLHVGSSSSPMKRCFSMECLSSSAPPPPAYYAALAASSSSPSVSSSSSLVSVEETPDKMASNGYLSDGLMGRGQERKKGVPWTEDEHRRFLAGLEKLGKGDWRGISRHFVTTRTPTQVASHAQKYFLRQSSLTHKKRRSSLFDVVENADRAMSGSEQHRLRLKDVSATASSMPGTELPALSLGISSSRAAKPERALPPSLSSLHQPRCSAAMSGGGGASPKHKHHPSSSVQMLSKQQAHQASIQAPDLELKISTAADHQAAAAGSSPRTPFFGTIRVT